MGPRVRRPLFFGKLHASTWHAARISLRFVKLVLFATVVCLVAPQRGPETWDDPLRSRNYEKAALLLHPIVMDAEYSLSGRDPEPARQLARLYSQGLGVRRDAIGACSLAHLARTVSGNAASTSTGDAARDDATMKDADRFVEEHCGRLRAAEQRYAARAFGCYALGMPEEVLSVGPTLVRIGHDGIGVLDAPDEDFVGLLNCPLYVAHVKATTVEPPRDAVPGTKPRLVIEMFFWVAHSREENGTPLYVLRWHAYEVVGKEIVVGGWTELAGPSPWPAVLVPADLDSRLSMGMDRRGGIRFTVDGPSGKIGWLPSPAPRTPKLL